MSLLELAFEGNGAHAGALLGFTAGVAVILGTEWWLAGIGIVALTMWGYVLAYLGYAWRRLLVERRSRDWSGGQQFIALGVIVANDSRIGTAPVPITLGGLVGTLATLAIFFTRIDFLALPTWTLVVLPLPLFPLLLPLGLGSAAYRTQRYNDVVDLPLE